MVSHVTRINFYRTYTSFHFPKELKTPVINTVVINICTFCRIKGSWCTKFNLQITSYLTELIYRSLHSSLLFFYVLTISSQISELSLE